MSQRLGSQDSFQMGHGSVLGSDSVALDRSLKELRRNRHRTTSDAQCALSLTQWRRLFIDATDSVMTLAQTLQICINFCVKAPFFQVYVRRPAWALKTLRDS